MSLTSFSLNCAYKIAYVIAFFVRVLCCFIPVKKWRKSFRSLILKQVMDKVTRSLIFQNYAVVQKKIAKKKKLKVLFLVDENQKWNCSFLYQEFDKDERFEPLIAVMGAHFSSGKKYKESLQANIDFFKRKKFNYVVAYDIEKDEPVNLNVYSPDIIFYLQPWGINKIHSLLYTSRFALACYVPYFILVCNNPWHHDNLFGRCVWRYFTDFSPNKESLLALFNELNNDRLQLSGHPKLDYYSQKKQKKTTTRKKIIYAPHHSFEQGKRGLKYATYDWSGDAMLEFARNHPEIDCVLKPHPRFKHALIINNIRTEEDVNAYFQAWNGLHNGFICDEGDYFDLFCQSDVMITDSASFIIEYLFTENPVILLVSKNGVEYNELGNMIVKNYYRAANVDKLHYYLNTIILDGDDPLRLQRKSCAASLRAPSQYSSQYIKEHLIESIDYKCEASGVLSDEM